jgi:asparagine synthase (glutamine-hydrolysing)
MCGIAGFVDLDGVDESAATVTGHAMARAIASRGPDGEAVWVDAAAGVALGFRRLAILDLSPLGDQPMRSRSGRYILVFNGEIFNHPELRQRMAARGHTFRGRSDTEVLLACIDELGFEAALPELRGMFAMAVWDAAERALYLARDRIGEKPLYYGSARSRRLLLFGSELKALHAHPDFDPSIDRASLMSFIRYGYVPSPRSIYEDVAKLPPGTWLRVTADGAGEPRAYYSLRAVAEAGLADPLRVGDDEAAALLRGELSRAVGEQMVADVPLGAFLSGGIDSSLIVALMQELRPRPVKTFSIGFPVAGYDETAYARRVSRHLGTDHTELYVSAAEALAVIPSLPTIYDEPFADSSQIPTVLVSRLARADVTVALTGDGGDELFGGYPRYAMLRRLAAAMTLPGRRLVAGAAHRVVDRLTRGGVEPTLDRRLADWARRRTEIACSRDPDELNHLYASFWYHPEWIVPGAVEPATHLPLAKEVLARGNVTERAMLADGLQTLPDDYLTKVDRAAMSVGLETRLPFLDPEVVALAWRLPFATKVRGGEGKLVLRRILERRLPAALFDRPKMGFMVPIVPWLRGPLRDWAESLLDDRRLEADGFLAASVIRRRWNAFQAGTRDWHALIWPVLMWQAWRAVARAPSRAPQLARPAAIASGE